MKSRSLRTQLNKKTDPNYWCSPRGRGCFSNGLRFFACCLPTLWVSPATAQLSDTFHPFAMVSVNHDDNLLRLSDNAVGQKSDTYKAAEAGVSFERPIGRQLLSARMKATRVTFDHFDALNYSGKQLDGALDWHILNHLQGHIGASYSETLAPFVDFHDAERNLRTSRREFFDGSWLVHPSWKLNTAWARNTYKYSLTAQKYNNRQEDAAELGGDYLPSTSSSIGLRLRRLSGTYTDRNAITTLLSDNSYRQDEVKVNVNWAISNASRLQFLGGAVRRKHEVLTIRDESGFNGRLVFDWSPSAKIRLNSSLWREFDAVEGSILNSSLKRGGNANVSYQISSKILANAGTRFERRRFQTLPSINTGGADLSDSLRGSTLGVAYLPFSQVRLDLNAFHDSRSGNRVLGTNSYKANGFSFNVSAQF